MANESVLDKLAKSLSAASSLQVTTVVGDFSVTVPDNGPFTVTKQGEQKVEGLHTRINLLQGDIGTIVSGNYYDADQPSPLQTLHSEQVANAQKIVQSNLEMLGKLAQWLHKSVGDALTDKTA